MKPGLDQSLLPLMKEASLCDESGELTPATRDDAALGRKSQATECLMQFQQDGRPSSHC